MPINPELYATSVLATGALILMPGPIVTLVIANSLAYGTRTGVQTALGASTGNALLAAGGALGLVAIMGYLGDIFDVVRWLGATYLIYLGIKAWRAKPMTLDDTQPMRSRNAVMGQGFLVAITNPKTTYILCRILSAICRPRAGSRLRNWHFYQSHLLWLRLSWIPCTPYLRASFGTDCRTRHAPEPQTA